MHDQPGEAVSQTSTVQIQALRELALGALERMYLPSQKRFVFRLQHTPGGIVQQGVSLRYTAITALGLAGEAPEAARRILAGSDLDALCGQLLEQVGQVENLGDVALILWAGARAEARLRQGAVARLRELRPLEGRRFTVELAWALSALSVDPDSSGADLREPLAARLLEAFEPTSGIFPHEIGAAQGLRSHVACFADLVYPIQALSLYSRATGGAAKALAAAARCAEQICRVQGPAGQWWWHYDVRTGDVVEGYPVYTVHQDAMGPMALFALREAGGTDHGANVLRGLRWMSSSPELGGGSLVDPAVGLVWRKVARREPGKLARSLQALASRVHPSLRTPGLDALLPPGAIDHETRPYEAGWLLHAFPRDPAGRW
jgi:hypothetical protein